MSLDGYVDDLPIDERPLAREWGMMDGDEFQARMGPEISRVAAAVEAQPRWYNLRLSEIARIGAAGILAVMGRGAIS